LIFVAVLTEEFPGFRPAVTPEDKSGIHIVEILSVNALARLDVRENDSDEGGDDDEEHPNSAPELGRSWHATKGPKNLR
jgi:hypothetical protein